MDITTLQQQAWQNAEDKGFHSHTPMLDLRSMALIRLALIHTEVSEATQEIKRHGAGDRYAIGQELADVLIRCADLATTLGIDLEGAVVTKLLANTQRPMHYGTPWEQTLT